MIHKCLSIELEFTSYYLISVSSSLFLNCAVDNGQQVWSETTKLCVGE